ncbi:MAG TPA: hypothetical protein VGP63_11125, partial [Planctomycetaceae bacterium]|nr:hypothetical protein [Planctomycetaceae bacterium]
MLAPTPREFDRLVPRALRNRRSLGRAALAIALLLGLLVWCSGMVRAGDEDDDEDDLPPVKRRVTTVQKESSDSSSPNPNGSTNTAGQPNDGFGIDFIPGFSAGTGVVQDRSLAPIEAFPYFLVNDSLFFSDLRFYPTIDGTFGGSLGG